MKLKLLLYISGDQGLETLKLCHSFSDTITVVLPEGFENENTVDYCIHSGIPYVIRSKKVSINLVDENFDLLISSSFQFLINKEEYNKLKYGGINIHASILPTYKGKHSDVWALINDEKTLGITVHKLNEKFDDGEILKIYQIVIDDTLSNLKIYQRVSSLLPKLIEDICTLKIFEYKEKYNGKDIFWRVRTLEDSRIDWSKSARKIFLFVRALSRPPIYAYSFHRKVKYSFIKVEETNLVREDYPGTVVQINQNFYVVCGDRCLVKIDELVEDSNVLIPGSVLQ